MKWKWLTTISSLILSVGLFAQVGTLNYSFRTFPQAGVLVSNVSGTSNKARVTKDTLGSLYNRFTAIDAQSWSGSSAAYELFRDSGLISHVVLGVGYGSPDTLWITNSTGFTLTDLATMLNQFFAAYPEYKGGILVLDNEELGSTHQSGRLFQYIDIAAVVQPICTSNHVLLSNGGFGSFFGINGYVFRWIKANPNYGQSVADTFATYAFTNGMAGSQYAAANTPNSNPSLEVDISGVDTIVSSDYFDILNFHMYQPVPNKLANPDTASYAWQNQVWRYYKECFSHANTSKPRQVGCNEVGQRFDSTASLVTNTLQMAFNLRFLMFDWWSGNGTSLNAKPLTRDDGTNKLNGVAFYDFVRQKYLGRPAP